MAVPTLSRKDDIVTPVSEKPRRDYDEFASMRIPTLAELSLQRVTWGPPPLRRRQFGPLVAYEVNVCLFHPVHVLVIQITDSNAKMEVQGAYFWKLKPGPLVIYKAACPYAYILIHHDPEPETEGYGASETDLRRLQGRPWVQNIYPVRGDSGDEIIYANGMLGPFRPFRA